MKKSTFGDGRFRNFWRRNGVYLVLTASLVAVAAVLISGLGTTLMEQLNQSQPENEPVEQVITDQPDERTTTTTTSTTTAASTTTTAQVEDVPELYVLPLTNTVQKPYSVDAPLYSETMRDWRIHTGVDFAGELGQTVKATAQGTVMEIQSDALWGNVIVIDHSLGVVSRYAGVEPLVQVGDRLNVSDPIGKLTTIPCEAEQVPHLHFEMIVDGVPIDPVEAIALEVRYADSVTE